MSNKRSHEGIIPPFMLLQLSRAFPDDPQWLATLEQTRKLYVKGEKIVKDLIAGKKVPGYRLASFTGGRALVLVYDAKNTTRLPGTKARFEGDPAVADKIVNNAFDFHTAVKRFLKEEFGIDSFDGKGGDLIGTVHYGRRYNNAFWNNIQMAYGDGDGVIFATFVLLDVVGHEFFHGVTSRYSDLEYYGESGWLNEHISDAFGVMLRQWVLNLTAEEDSWLVGPGLFTASVKGRALRDMLNPGTAYDDPRLGKDPQPDHYDRRYKGSSDNGGVHINSGIPNKAFATFARAVGGYAWKGAAGKVWMAANCGPDHVGSNCTAHEFARKTVEICTKDFPSEVQKLKDAWALVGINV